MPFFWTSALDFKVRVDSLMVILHYDLQNPSLLNILCVKSVVGLVIFSGQEKWSGLESML